MAARIQHQISVKKTCFVKFPGHVAPYIRAALLKEMIKYLLYHSHQIQMPFEQIKFDFGSSEDCDLRRHTMNAENAKKLISNLEEIFTNIDTLFSMACVTRFAIIFGATIVSPREVYHMTITEKNLPSSTNSDSTNSSSTKNILRTKTCVRTLMKELVTSDALLSSKKASEKIPPPTKMFLLVYAHRNSGIQWFVPINFTSPKRGEQFWIKVEHGESSEIDEVDAEDSHEDEDWIWFKAPVDVKGFLEKSTNSSKGFQL